MFSPLREELSCAIFFIKIQAHVQGTFLHDYFYQDVFSKSMVIVVVFIVLLVKQLALLVLHWKYDDFKGTIIFLEMNYFITIAKTFEKAGTGREY